MVFISEVSMKLLLHYFLFEITDFETESLQFKFVDISCRENLLKIGSQIFNTTTDKIELALLEDGTKIWH